jgi:heme/copper-type cytochrome/quinol oxidase subunit 1
VADLVSRQIVSINSDVVHLMNWEAVSAVGQIIGAIAVVISVVYLAVQVRSNARQMRLASATLSASWSARPRHRDCIASRSPKTNKGKYL